MAIDKYHIDVNGVDITSAVEINSYQTAYEPVYGETLTTMDGVEHVNVLRHRGSVSFSFNPQVADMAAKISAAFSKIPAYVHYYCLQRDADVYATMRIDGISAQAIPKIRLGGSKWINIGSITLQEL